MKIRITYKEAARILAAKTGRNVMLHYGGNPSRVVAELYGIPLFVKVESVSDDAVVLSHQIGRDPESGGLMNMFKRGAQTMAEDAINNAIETVVKNPAVTVNDDRTVNVSIHEVEQLKTMLQTVSLEDITFDENGINVDMILLL